MVVPKIAPYFTEVDTLLQSPDEKSILATTNLGFKYIFDVHNNILKRAPANILEYESTDFRRVYDYSNKDEVYCLATDTGVHLCNWNSLVQSGSEGGIHSIPQHHIYSVSWASKSVFAGGDNGLLVELDCQTGQEIKRFTGHNGSVNTVKKRSDSTFVSAGFDGICRIWDRRIGNCIQEFNPSDWSKAERPKLGSHIRCLDVWDDWIVCGGGPNLSLWYMKEKKGVQLLDMGASTEPRSARFFQDTIIATGNDCHIFHWSLMGTVKYKVTSKLSLISSIIINTSCKDQPIVIAAGSPNQLNVFLDFGYLSHTVAFSDS